MAAVGRHTMPCTACDGRGRVDLPVHLESVLSAMRNGCRTSSAVASALGISRTSACNRLTLLCVVGLATRRKDGREFVYREPDMEQ